jgi:hypothetical protein
MAELADFLPRHAWLVVLGLVVVAGGVFFVPPSVGAAVGLTGPAFLLAMATVELLAALGIASVVVYYRADPGTGNDEWRFDP